MPIGWTKRVRSALLHAISLAATALAIARGQATTSRRKYHRLQADLEQASTEIALLREELDIKDARWSWLSSRRRPHYTPIERMRILQVKAARGWSREQAAHAFLIDEQTMRSWVRRVDEEGERALVRISGPVNKFPDFVRYLVRQLKALLPTMGKVRIAQVLARAGLHLGATTVGRMLREPEPILEASVASAEMEIVETRVIQAKHPGEVWHIDLTTVPIAAGFWVPWLPFAMPQSWPFCWWIAVVVDHFSQAVVGFAVFFRRPTSAEVQKSLSRAIRRAGHPPRCVITDQGRQFRCKFFQRWCRRRGIRPRFGAVGKYGSLAVVERFIRSMKTECTRRMLVPVRLDAMRLEIRLYVLWYNQHRPNQALGGRTPCEVYEAIPPANERRRFEPRVEWPRRSPCASPQAEIKGERGANLSLIIGYLEGRRHLPVIELKRAA
jgi:putative transposase